MADHVVDTTLVVKGVSRDLNERDLLERFGGLVSVSRCKIVEGIDGILYGRVKVNGREENVKKCIRTLSGTTWKGSKVIVTEEGKPVMESKRKQKKREAMESKKSKFDEKKVENSKRHHKNNKEELIEDNGESSIKEIELSEEKEPDIIDSLQEEKQRSLKIIESILNESNEFLCDDFIEDAPTKDSTPAGNKGTPTEGSTPAGSKDIPTEGSTSEENMPTEDSTPAGDKDAPTEGSTPEENTPTEDSIPAEDKDLKLDSALVSNSSNGVMFRFGFLDDVEAEEIPAAEMAEDEIDMETQNETITPSDHVVSGLFFFHPKDPALRNRLDNVSFCRTDTVQELFKGWSEKKRCVRNSCKRVRKESLKRMKRKT